MGCTVLLLTSCLLSSRRNHNLSEVVCRARMHFFNGSPWRRAMLFVFLVRHLLGYASQKIWHKFSYKDYKLNYRCFARWMKNDKIIMQKSKHVQDLPDEADVSPAKKRTNMADTTMSSEHSPYKRRCVVDSDTTDDDDKCDDE